MAMPAKETFKYDTSLGCIPHYAPGATTMDDDGKIEITVTFTIPYCVLSKRAGRAPYGIYPASSADLQGFAEYGIPVWYPKDFFKFLASYGPHTFGAMGIPVRRKDTEKETGKEVYLADTADFARALRDTVEKAAKSWLGIARSSGDELSEKDIA